MADSPPTTFTVEELAGKAGLPSYYLDREFCEEHAPLLAEYCDPWETIGYHLRLTKSHISTIKGDHPTTDMQRIATLKKWMEKFAHKATYRILIKALIRSEHVQQALNL